MHKKILFSAIIIFSISLLFKYQTFSIYKINILLRKDVKSEEQKLIEVFKKDPTEAFKQFKLYLKEGKINYSTCHGFMHKIGHTSEEIFGFENAMKYQDNICGGGYIHGVLEGKFGILNEKEILKNINTLCKDNAICIHGLGHGLMIANKNNLDKSISYCDEIKFKEKTNCYDGVFMHILDMEETGIKKNKINKEQSLNICVNARDDIKVNCYFYLPRIEAYSNKNNAYKLCLDLNNNIYEKACFMGFGTMIMKYDEKGIKENVLEICKNINNEKYKEFCEIGVEQHFEFGGVR